MESKRDAHEERGTVRESKGEMPSPVNRYLLRTENSMDVVNVNTFWATTGFLGRHQPRAALGWHTIPDGVGPLSSA